MVISYDFQIERPCNLITLFIILSKFYYALAFKVDIAELRDLHSNTGNSYRNGIREEFPNNQLFCRNYHGCCTRKSVSVPISGISKDCKRLTDDMKDTLLGNNDQNGNLIRNFCIIAHVDHGKSTLADRFLEYTKAVSPKDMQEQHLDNMELERERGITIKLQTALIKYTSKTDGNTYFLNLIDTPGHIDFNHEARRSISACEGAILVVDGTKGIQAQTVSTASIAIESGLKIIPVVNKIDIPHCDFRAVATDLKSIFNFEEDEILKVSAKMGVGVEAILEAIIQRIPPPKIDLSKPLRALVFDSHYDPHKGVINYIRVVDGYLKRSDEVIFMGVGAEAKVSSLGVLLPEMSETQSLTSGNVGWFCSNIKDPAKVRVGDTVAHKVAVRRNLVSQVNTFEESKPTVYAGLYPTGSTDFIKLKAALAKLKLNDHSFVYEPCDSSIAGQGFKCGFNGLLHLDVTVQRLEREHDAEVVVTSPSVPYKCTLRDGSVVTVHDAINWPQDGTIKVTEEPWTNVTVHIPSDAIGKIMGLLDKMRGEFIDKTEIEGRKITKLNYRVPLIEVISDFFDKLKLLTNGYGSFEYKDVAYRPLELCKLKILVNGEEAHGLATITPKDAAYDTGKLLVETLCKIIPKKQFKIPIQAAIGKRVIASSSISAIKKNVIERCSGGDPSRKKKLLDNQARGKKQMAQVGNVEIPADAYKAVLKALRT